MDLEKIISQTLEPLSGFKKERWSDTEYAVEASNVNDLTVFLSFTKDGIVLEYHHVNPISYGSLTEANRQLVDNCLQRSFCRPRITRFVKTHRKILFGELVLTEMGRINWENCG